MRKLVVGSRRSKLALTQSQQFIDKLKAIDENLEIEIKEIVTKGDRIIDKQLSKVGGKGLFVKEIQNELFDHSIDMAIHSLKDVPSVIPEGLTLGNLSINCWLCVKASLLLREPTTSLRMMCLLVSMTVCH